MGSTSQASRGRDWRGRGWRERCILDRDTFPAAIGLIQLRLQQGSHVVLQVGQVRAQVQAGITERVWDVRELLEAA